MELFVTEILADIDWRKENVLTRGDLGIDSVSMSQEVSRGHSR